LTGFTSEQPAVRWFARLGLPLTPGDIAGARAYLAALGYPSALPVLAVNDWHEAERIVRDPDWDSAWWNREQQERDRLQADVEGRLGSAGIIERLTAATDLAADTIHAAAIIAAASAASGGEAMVRAASGAAAMALHEFTLAQLAGCGPGHLFMRKYRLFESGRWPLGVLRGAFHLF
jgi:hypothetical protein